MKFYKELNLTTDDGKLVGLVVLPESMTLLVEGNGPEEVLVPIPPVVFDTKFLKKQAKHRRIKRGPLHRVEGATGRAMRRLDPNQIAKVRNAPDSLRAEKLAQKYGASRTTGARIWAGKDAYAYLGPRDV